MNTVPFTEPPRIAGYDLAAPTEADVVSALGRVFGPERGAELWARACGSARIRAGTVRDTGLLASCAAALAAEGGAAATVARSVAIRLRTYDRLAARAAASRGEGA